ncbi:hypothetical protein PUN28_013514 [Cardiocondyla obscurior]
MESAAAAILKRAVDMDKKEQYTVALVLYHEGVQLLCNVMKEIKNDSTKAEKKEYLARKADEYVSRAEIIKKLIEKKKLDDVHKKSTEPETKKSAEIHRELIKIESGSTGYGYTSVFGRFLDDNITYVDIEDPYIRTSHQCQNLVRLCELIVQKCRVLTRISLLTTYEQQEAEQISRLAELKESLASRNISFNFSFNEELHDRQITFSSGWVIKIGRGLDYFKPSKGRFVLGSCDLELRPCRETTIDIFHISHLKGETKSDEFNK